MLDINGGGEPNKTNDQGLGGYAYLEPTYVEYDWQLSTSDYRFIDKPLVTYVMTNSDGSSFDSGTFYVSEDTMTSLTMDSLMTSCFNELNARYAEIRGIPPSHEEAIAWEVNSDEYTMSWSANTYAPDLELSITLNNTSELMTMNDDHRSGSIGPWYGCDCIYHDEVFIDTTHIVVGLDGYSETASVTIPRGEYTGISLVNMIKDGFNSIDGYQVFTREENGGTIVLGPRSNLFPAMIIVFNDSPFLPLSPGTSRGMNFTFHRNWYVKIPEITTPYDFTIAVFNGVLKSELRDDWDYLERVMEIYLDQPMRIQFTTTPVFNSNDFNGFIDWPQSSTYKRSFEIYFPYHSMMLSPDEYTSIGYSNDSQSFEDYVSSRAIQAELVRQMNNYFGAYGIKGVKWIAGADGYYINADHVFTLTGNIGTTIPVSGSLSHTWKMPYNDGAYYTNFGPMVAKYPVDITNGLSNIRLYCNIVKSKTNTLLANIPMDNLYKNYFYKDRMVIPCSELLDRIEYELKDENDESLSFIGNIYLLIGFTVLPK